MVKLRVDSFICDRQKLLNDHWDSIFSGFRRQQQEEAPAQPHDLHDVPVARVGEGLREVTLSGCLQ